MYCSHCGGVIFREDDHVRRTIRGIDSHFHSKCAKLADAQSAAYVDPKNIFADAPRLVRCEYCLGQIDTLGHEPYGQRFGKIGNPMEYYYYHIDCDRAVQDSKE